MTAPDPMLFWRVGFYSAARGGELSHYDVVAPTAEVAVSATREDAMKRRVPMHRLSVHGSMAPVFGARARSLKIYALWADGEFPAQWESRYVVIRPAPADGQEEVVETIPLDRHEAAAIERRVAEHDSGARACANQGDASLIARYGTRAEIALRVIRDRHPELEQDRVIAGAMSHYSVTGGSGAFGAWAVKPVECYHPLLVDTMRYWVAWARLPDETVAAITDAIGEYGLEARIATLRADPDARAYGTEIGAIHSAQTGDTSRDFSRCSGQEHLVPLKQRPELWPLFLKRAPVPRLVMVADVEAYEVALGADAPEGFDHCLILGATYETVCRAEDADRARRLMLSKF
jgi:hypothetical protein